MSNMPTFSPELVADVKIYPSLKKRIMLYAFGIYTSIYRLFTCRKRVFKNSERVVFLYEPFGMGDVICMQPLVMSLLDDGYKVVVAVKKQWSDIFPKKDGLILVSVSPEYCNYEGNRKKGVFSDLNKLRQGISDQLHQYGLSIRGALGIDIRGDIRSVLLMYMLRCGSVYTFTRYVTANDSAVFRFAAKCIEPNMNTLRTIQNMAFRKELGCEDSVIPKASLAHLVDDKANDEKDYLVFIPCAGWGGKECDMAMWKHVVEMLREKNFDKEIVFCCGPGEEERLHNLVAETNSKLKLCRNMRDWVNIIKQSLGVVCVNTGGMHIAASLEKEMVVLESTSRLPLWAPFSANSTVMHNYGKTLDDGRKVYPCHQAEENLEYSKKCMGLHKAEDVVREIFNILKKK